ncbi:MAG: hypothetical protein O3C60_02185 [Planctomycetota bacterium]|nr:hypothetical protein [Planctomycetota bacterium]
MAVIAVMFGFMREDFVVQRQVFDKGLESGTVLARDANSRQGAPESTAFGERSAGSNGQPSCLLVNLSGHGFQKIAPRSGWSCVSADSAEVALDCLRHMKFSFVVVNVQGDKAAAEGLRSLFESHTGDGVGVWAVFGSELDAADEIWARQLGVWFYLSGLPDDTGFQWICDEALAAGGVVTVAA